jgi:hypothetical protein
MCIDLVFICISSIESYFSAFGAVLKFVTLFCLQTCVADTRWLKRFLHCLTKKNSPKSRYKRIDRDMSANSSWLFEASL